MARRLARESLAGVFAREQPSGPRAEIEAWEPWLRAHFPSAVRAPFAARHVRLWEWFDALEPGTSPRPHGEIWPRGGAKSTTAELGVVRVGVKKSRSFALYVSGTQSQANKHVQATAARFHKLGIGRAVNGYGNSLGWRIDLLRVDNGFNVLALGLDAAARGVKLDDFRPDLIILDDIDGRHDTDPTIARKIETLTETVLPTGSADVAVLFIQNRVHDASIASQLARGTADFLLDREVFEEPAVIGLDIEQEELPDSSRRYRVTAGEPTWQGQNLKTCEKQINLWGRSAFMREAQHDTSAKEDGLWERDRDIDAHRTTKSKVPDLIRIAVAIDPNASEGNDEAGIMVGGIALIDKVMHGYLLEDATVAGGPATWAREAVAAFRRHEADVMVAEKNNGGDMVTITIGTVPGAPKVKLMHASRGKLVRAEPVQKLCEDGRVHHVGVFVALEKELTTFTPGDDSPNRLDAYVWLFTELMLGNSRAVRVYFPGMEEPAA